MDFLSFSTVDIERVDLCVWSYHACWLSKRRRVKKGALMGERPAGRPRMCVKIEQIRLHIGYRTNYFVILVVDYRHDTPPLAGNCLVSFIFFLLHGRRCKHFLKIISLGTNNRRYCFSPTDVKDLNHVSTSMELSQMRGTSLDMSYDVQKSASLYFIVDFSAKYLY